eukprot:Skav216354  [mRNA]  locus=scaffold2385:234086:238616:- [translate_table: standard]
MPRHGDSPTPAFFPIPLPFVGVFGCAPAKGSALRHTRHLSQHIHVMVMALNFWNAGYKHGDMELLRRVPSSQHLLLYKRLRDLIKSEGACEIPDLPSTGRRFPELHARISELSSKLTEFGVTSCPYDKKFAGATVEKKEDIEELKPYHDLDPDRIKLHGTGKWDATPYLEDNLVMAYREPSVLLHGDPSPVCPTIRDEPITIAKLAKKWDDLDLLHIHSHAIDPQSPVRIFGALKDSATDRQIGDRRGQNGLEAKVEGPSQDLPSGPDLCQLFCNPKTHSVSISITDRKDFYHQLKVSESRAVSNTIAPSVPLEMLANTKAYSHYMLRSSRKRRYDRLRQGDHLDDADQRALLLPEEGCVWTSFASVLQGDHAGVEVATQAHMSLLQKQGLLDEHSIVKASRPLRSSKHAQGLVIDDYFSVSVQEKSVPPCSSQSKQDYDKAARAYESEKLLGSPHKDIVSQPEGRVIGAYINGSQRATCRGLVTLGAPMSKRLALAYMSMQVAQLPYTSDSLHLCLVGGWVSILGYRRPLMSLLDRCFHVVDMDAFDRDYPKLVPLSRRAANELVLLAVLIPLAVTELSAPYDEHIYCTDASLSRGAILKADIAPEVAEVLWKTTRSKGAYTRLLSQAEVALSRLGELEDHLDDEAKATPNRPLAFSFEFIEVFAGSLTKGSAVYTDALARTLAEVVAEGIQRNKAGMRHSLAGDVLRKVAALVTAAGLYVSVPFVPTRLNVADDPTRCRQLRDATAGLELSGWTEDELFALAELPKTRRWASNWVRLVIKSVGPKILDNHHRNTYRQVIPGIMVEPPSHAHTHSDLDFDKTLGYPGEGPNITCGAKQAMPSRPRRWIFHTGTLLLSLPIAVVWRLLVWSCVLSACSRGGGGGVICAAAMPLRAATPGEVRKAAERSQRPALPLGRPVTQATTSLRSKYWAIFSAWTLEEGFDIGALLAEYHTNVDLINQLLVSFGRNLYEKGKSYNQFAETINSVTDHQPALRRMMQASWDLGFSWCKAEPSQHHVAAPFQIVLAMLTVALMWGWSRMAGCIALSFGALLRPGELLNAYRQDLLLPSDIYHTACYALLSIREPKSRFTHARHQSARLDASDLVDIAELAFSALHRGEKLWPYSGQTYRHRFRCILQALKLPSKHEAGLRCLDPGSLRSGGATWIMLVSEDPELCRRRGRWASMKMMEVYVQETMAIQYLQLISPAASRTVFDIAFTFNEVVCQVKRLRQAFVPEQAWYLLLSQKQKPEE